jgi:DNA gyrase/topoisomerase IV subunit B
VVGKCDKEKHGTEIKFYADGSIFTEGTKFSYDTILDRLRHAAYLTKGVRTTLINEANGNRDQAAKILGLSRPTFFRKAKELGLVRERIKEAKSSLNASDGDARL